LLVERIGVLRWRLAIHWSWRLSICRRLCSIARRRWYSIPRRCRDAITRGSWRDTYPSLTARVGSKLVRRARISVPLLLVIRHSEGGGDGRESRKVADSGDAGKAVLAGELGNLRMPGEVGA
jgi:hypothetical protein